MKSKVYLSDEGYGHIVRQRAIMTELLKQEPSIDFTLQTHKFIDFASKNTPAEHFIDRYNNISWHKQDDSSPDTIKIEDHNTSYFKQIEHYVTTEEKEFNFQFLITDFVYEAFNLAEKFEVPCFGVAHFTWDWFFSKIYPRVINDQLFNYFTSAAKKARKLYFPPFTPSEILDFYSANAVSVPFIIRQDVQHKVWPKTDRLKVLIMDSGAGLMASNIQNAFSQFESSEWLFGVQDKLGLAGDQIFNIDRNHLLVDYVKGADLIIGRPGFNTISECIAYRKPMLLISESMNPEMDFNIAELKKMRLGAFMAMQDFNSNFVMVLKRFLNYEFKMIDSIMKEHEYEVNGANTIAADILNTL
jgi:hypothetical protein